MRSQLIFLLPIYFSAVSPKAQESLKMTPESYLETFAQAAIENMQSSKVPASITLAQGMLESGNGNSELARQANNHFGIKCHSGWTGKTYHLDDDAPNECFRAYDHVLDSYRDHAHFLTSRSRYAGLFELEITDYKAWARGLKAAGYATNPQYADLLISLIERYQLHQYDQPEALAKNNPKTKDGSQKPKTDAHQKPTAPSGLHQVLFVNGLKAIRLAYPIPRNEFLTQYDLNEKQLLRYNEIGPLDSLETGQLLFLEPKRNAAARGVDFHSVQEGETWYSIAHKYGMKTEKLMKKNGAWYGSPLEVGQQLWLRKNKNPKSFFF